MIRTTRLNDEYDGQGNQRIRIRVANDLIRVAADVQYRGLSDKSNLRRVICAVREQNLCHSHLYRLTVACHDIARAGQEQANEERESAAWLVARAAFAILFRTFQPSSVHDFFDFARLASAMARGPYCYTDLPRRERERCHKRLAHNLKAALAGLSIVDYGLPSWHARHRQETAAKPPKKTKSARKQKAVRKAKAPRSAVVAAFAESKNTHPAIH